MGGDADTLGAITGSIAIADKDSSYYIPPQLEQLAWDRLTTQQQAIVEEFEFAVANEPLF